MRPLGEASFMIHECIDTNVIVRFLVETPESIAPHFKGVFRFFQRIEEGVKTVHLPEIVLFQAFFVLTSYYGVPSALAAEKLEKIIGFKGIVLPTKPIAEECLRIVRRENVDIVDAWIVSYSTIKGIAGAYSFDKDLSRLGLKLLKVE
jgi:predicted nucleic acid-binding protein